MRPSFVRENKFKVKAKRDGVEFQGRSYGNYDDNIKKHRGVSTRGVYDPVVGVTTLTLRSGSGRNPRQWVVHPPNVMS